jgi:dsRNA-specific ribonuclease
VELAVSGRDPVRASGPSKRAAEILAAGEMLELIGKGSE